MNLPPLAPFDANLDLVLDRVIDVPPSLVWKAWTEPEHLVKWFTPAPWSTKSVEIDLRPGGKFNSVMLSPEGQEFPNQGCVLEVVHERRLVFTDAMVAGFRPSANPFFTGAVSLEPAGEGGTRYVARAIHRDAETRQKHAEMGFADGWGKALDQLVEYIQKHLAS